MMKKLAGLALTLAMIFVLSACDTEGSENILTDGIWTYESLSTNSDNQADKLGVEALKLSMDGATMEFKDNGTYIQTLPLTEEVTTGKWSMLTESQLTIDPEGDLIFPGVLETLSDTRLVYIQTVPSIEPGNVGTQKLTTSWTR